MHLNYISEQAIPYKWFLVFSSTVLQGLGTVLSKPSISAPRLGTATQTSDLPTVCVAVPSLGAEMLGFESTLPNPCKQWRKKRQTIFKELLALKYN